MSQLQQTIASGLDALFIAESFATTKHIKVQLT